MSACSLERYSLEGTPIPSRVLNASERGLLVELDQPLVKGEPVRIRFRPESENVQPAGETSCMAMVRWSAQQDGRFSGMYAAGLEIAPKGKQGKQPVPSH